MDCATQACPICPIGSSIVDLRSKCPSPGHLVAGGHLLIFNGYPAQVEWLHSNGLWKKQWGDVDCVSLERSVEVRAKSSQRVWNQLSTCLNAYICVSIVFFLELTCSLHVRLLQMGGQGKAKPKGVYNSIFQGFNYRFHRRTTEGFGQRP